MAQHTLVQLIDDLDGSDADETVSFGLDGQDYVIDLTTEHAEDLRTRLGEYAAHARRARGGNNRRRTAGGPSARAEDRTAVRDWAREQSYEVAESGRIRLVSACACSGLSSSAAGSCAKTWSHNALTFARRRKLIRVMARVSSGLRVRSVRS